MEIVKEIVIEYGEILYIPMFFYLISIIITKEPRKVILFEFLWWTLFLLLTNAFCYFEILSWKLVREAGALGIILFIFNIVVNSIFVFIQGLLTTSTSNLENRNKMLRQKRICFLVHTIILFGFYSFWETGPFFFGNKKIDWDWSFYIIVFVVGSNLSFDWLFYMIIGCEERPVFLKLINKFSRRYRVSRGSLSKKETKR